MYKLTAAGGHLKTGYTSAVAFDTRLGAEIVWNQRKGRVCYLPLPVAAQILGVTVMTIRRRLVAAKLTHRRQGVTFKQLNRIGRRAPGSLAR